MGKMRRILALWLFPHIVFTALAAGEALPQGAREGSLLKVTAGVNIERNDDSIVAQTRMDILGGDVIVTGAGAEAALRLNDGHVITISENSQFEVDERGAKKKNGNTCMIYYGVVYVRSAPGKSGASLQIQTPTAVAGVRGTNFGVAVAPDGGSRFGVEDGAITVETEGGASSDLSMLQEVTVESGDQADLRPSPYAPDQQSLETWRAERMSRILANPAPVAGRLSANLAMNIKRGMKLLGEINVLADEVIRVSKEAMAFKKRGQADFYQARAARVRVMFRRLIPMIRLMVRLDNRVQARGKQLAAILKAATAKGSPTPPEQVKIIKEHMNKILALKENARKLHRGRAKFMRVKAPQVRQATAELY